MLQLRALPYVFSIAAACFAPCVCAQETSVPDESIAEFAREPANAPRTPFRAGWSRVALRGTILSPDWKRFAQLRGAGVAIFRLSDTSFVRRLSVVFPASRAFDSPPGLAAGAWSRDSKEFVAWGFFLARGAQVPGKLPDKCGIWAAAWNTQSGALKWKLEDEVRGPNATDVGGDARLESDGTAVLQIAAGNNVRFWRVRNGKIVARLAYPNRSEAQFSPTGKFLGLRVGNALQLRATNSSAPPILLPSYAGQLKAWGKNDEVVAVQGYSGGVYRTRDGKLLWKFPTDEYGLNPFLGVSRNGKWIVTRATRGQTQTYELRDLMTGKILRRFNWQSDPYEMAPGFSPDDRTFALSFRGLSFYQMPSGRLARRIESFGYGPQAAAFTPDGKMLATADWGNGSATLWDLRAKGSSARFEHSNNGLGAIAISPDATKLATGNEGSCGEDTIRVWDVATRKPLWQARSGYLTSGVAILRWSPDGALLAATCLYGGPAQIFDARSGKRLAVLDGHASTHGDLVRYNEKSPKRRDPALFWSSDARELWVGGSNGIAVWNRSGGLLRRLESIKNVRSLARCPSGQRIAVGTFDGEIVLMRRADQKVAWRHDLETDWHGDKAAVNVAFLPSDRVVSWSDGLFEKGKVRLWDARNGTVSQTIVSPLGARQVATSRDGIKLVITGNGGIGVWQCAPEKAH